MTVSYSKLREDFRNERAQHMNDIDELLTSLDNLSGLSHDQLLNGCENSNTKESTQIYNEKFDATEKIFTRYKNKIYSNLTIPKASLLNYANFDDDNYAISEDVVDDLIDEYDHKMGLKEKDCSENEFDLQNMINCFVENGDCSIINKFLQTRMYIVIDLDKEDVLILTWTYELYAIIIQLMNCSMENINYKEYIKKLMTLYNKLDLKIEKRRSLIKQNIKFFIKALKIDNTEERQNLLVRILQNEVLENDIQLLIDFIEELYYTLKPNETKKTSAQKLIEGALYYIDGYGEQVNTYDSLIENGGFVKPVQLPPHLTEFHPILKCSVSKTEINNTANSLRRLKCGHLFGQKAINDWVLSENNDASDYSFNTAKQMPEITCPYCQKKTVYKDIKPATFVNLNLFVLENLYDYIKE